MHKSFLVALSLLAIVFSCANKSEEATVAVLNEEWTLTYDSTVTYGYFCGKCLSNCAPMYRHKLDSNSSSFWKDTSDYYVRGGESRFDQLMSDQAERIGLEFLQKIPESIFQTESVKNVFGCPDCADGCGLYFQFVRDSEGSEPVVFVLPYDLQETSGDVKLLGELLRNALDSLNEMN